MDLIYSLDELTTTAQKIIATTKHKILLFEAAMGVGKTSLIKEICIQLGVQDVITSPTYALVNEYQAKEIPIYHFDFYRIKQEEEAYDIGFEEYLEAETWIFIEWPDKIYNLIPENTTTINIKLLDNGKRKLSMV